jgi:hypothetical protein
VSDMQHLVSAVSPSLLLGDVEMLMMLMLVL